MFFSVILSWPTKNKITKTNQKTSWDTKSFCFEIAEPSNLNALLRCPLSLTNKFVRITAAFRSKGHRRALTLAFLMRKSLGHRRAIVLIALLRCPLSLTNKFVRITAAIRDKGHRREQTFGARLSHNVRKSIRGWDNSPSLFNHLVIFFPVTLWLLPNS